MATRFQGRLLRRSRLRADFSTIQASSELGVHRSTLTRYENNEHDPPAGLLSAASELYDAPIMDWFVDDQESPVPAGAV